MARFSAKITINAGHYTKSVYDAVSADNLFYPENPVDTRVAFDDNVVVISVFSDHLPHMRANLNSVLRLVMASHDSISSVE